MESRRVAVPPAKLPEVGGGIAAVGQARLQPVSRQLPSGGLTTFDVFETLLVRCVTPHHEIFDRLGRAAAGRGLIPCSPHAFARTREAANHRARSLHGDAMCLREIYADLAAALGMPAEVTQELMALEMAEEARALRPVETARPLLVRARQAGRGVAFVSDMYLPSDFIREQLERHGFWEEGDRLYVSHEHGCEKRGGRLFGIVAAAEGVSPRAITHFGNDTAADWRGPQKAGATGRLVTAGNPNRYERALEACRHETDGRAAILAGASRLARTSLAATSGRDQAMIDVAAGVIAPLLTSFVLWLFQQVEERGLKRLYFLSRDAEILMEIALQLAPKLRNRVELRYLYASRLAWNSAVSGPDTNPHVWYSVIYQSATGFTNAELLERVGLEPGQIDRITASDRKEWSGTRDRTILRTTLEGLQADGTLQRLAERNKELVLDYLGQEGLFDDVPHAVVDVGWRGTQHDVLIELQRERGIAPAHGLFFGLDLSGSRWGSLRSGFYFDARRHAAENAGEVHDGPWGYQPPRVPEELGKVAPREHYSLFEMFCAGREGSLLGYRREDGRVLPVTDARRPAEVRAWNIDRVYETVAAYVANIDLDETSFLNVDVRPALGRVVDLLWQRPTRLEAEAWGTFPWELGLGSSRCTRQFAPPYDHRYIGTKLGLDATLKTQWPAASLARSNPVMLACKTIKDGSAYPRLIGKSKAAVRRLVG